jgi:hypothetical protein
MLSHFLKFCMFFALALGLYACANQLAGGPSGGAKDVRKPRIRFSSPKNQSLQVRGNQIIIQFDEQVKLKNIKANLRIIPNTDNDYEYTEKKNRLTLTFKKVFASNTTYVLIFDDVVEDVNESNKATNMRLAFSTGSQIDSFRVNGVVRDRMTNKPDVEAVVMLYDAEDTFKIEKHKPLYYAKTDTIGRYSLSNVRQGRYLIYALKEEKKKNLIYDDYREKIGFQADTLEVNALAFPFVDLKTMTYDFRPFKTTTKRVKKQYFEVKANKKIYDFQTSFADSALQGKVLAAIDNETLRFYNYTDKPSTDSLLTYLTLKDSTGAEVKDTVKVKFDEIKEKEKEKKRPKFEVKVLPQTNSKFMGNETANLYFNFNLPVVVFNADSLLLRIDKDTLKITADDFEIDNKKLQIKYKKPLKFKESMTLKYKKATFVSIEKDTLAAGDVNYSLKKEDDFATLSGIVKVKATNFILQLLGENNVIEQEQVNARDFIFKYVNPGKKSFRVVIDQNANGKWDAGDFKAGIPPEKIFFYETPDLQKTAPNWLYEDIIVEVKDEE